MIRTGYRPAYCVYRMTHELYSEEPTYVVNVIRQFYVGVGFLAQE